MTRSSIRHWYIKLFKLLAISGYLLISGCAHAPAPALSQQNASYISDSLLKANKEAVQNEDAQIRLYINRMGWQMQETGTGLRYLIAEKGKGPAAKTGNRARIEFELRLITGELCYSSQKTGPKEFRIGSGGVESGLEEGILLLHKGDRAKFILPSHLAFGLVGDQDKIPGRCSIIYDVHLLDLN